MSNQSYIEKLRDPRWQKKRLEIMSRDDFSCQKCGDDSSTLNVHHGYYRTGNQPWEYPNSSLTTLCEDCHGYETDLALQEKITLSMALAEKGLLAAHFFELAEAIHSNPIDRFDDFTVTAIAMALGESKMIDFMREVYSEYLSSQAKNREHPGGGPTAAGLNQSATGRDSCESGTAERRDEAGVEA